MGISAMKFHPDGSLPSNGEIFVFGSNLAGRHGAGAAKIAQSMFGAKYGFGRGIMASSWAIPTKSKDLRTLPLSEIKGYVSDFVNYTRHADIKFFVTRVGCGLAGYKDHQIAPMFKGAKNCSFAEEWQPYLEEI
jgi:hypothetical protein